MIANCMSFLVFKRLFFILVILYGFVINRAAEQSYIQVWTTGSSCISEDQYNIQQMDGDVSYPDLIMESCDTRERIIYHNSPSYQQAECLSILDQHSGRGQSRECQIKQSYDALTNYTYALKHNAHMYQYGTLRCLQQHISLPEQFKDTFEKRGWFSSWGTLSSEQYACIFYNQLIHKYGYKYTGDQLLQAQYLQMRRWKEYHYQGFRDFIKTFPGYEEYILALDKELRSDQVLSQKVVNTEWEASDYILDEAHRIKKQRNHAEQQERERKCQQRYATIQEIFSAQQAQLEREDSCWEVTHPQRNLAYQRTLSNPKEQGNSTFTLTKDSKELLKKHAIDSTSYNYLYGNHLQHELHREIIDYIERAANLSYLIEKTSIHSLQTAHKNSVELLDDARLVNQMGDCRGASKLIDVAATLLDYCSVAVQGALDGVKQIVSIGTGGVFDRAVGSLIGGIVCGPFGSFVGGTIGALGAYEMIRHPKRTAQAIRALALQISTLIHEYIPQYHLPLYDGNHQDALHKMAQDHERIARNWQQFNTSVATWWRETPTRDKIYVTVCGTTSIITDIVMTHACLRLTGSMIKSAAAEKVILGEQVTVKAAGAPGEAPHQLFNSLSPLEKESHTPATTLLHHMAADHCILAFCKKLEIPDDHVLNALKNIADPKIQGCVNTLSNALTEFGHLPGVADMMKNFIKHSQTVEEFSRAKGIFNELATALKLKKEGHNILEFGRRFGEFGKYELDIITATHVIECKNVCWDVAKQWDPNFDTLLKQMKRGVKEAHDVLHKPFVLISKNKFPPELDWLKQEIIQMNITIIEGY